MKRTSPGFSLIEILVALAITAILGIAVSASLAAFLRGANKTEMLKEIKQNADQVLSTMEVNIRNASDVTSDCSGTAGPSISFANADGTTTTYACIIDSTLGINRLQQTDTATNYMTNNQVAIADCSAIFSCMIAASGPKIVTIRYTVQQARAPTDLTLSAASQNYELTVALRNK